MTYIPGHRFGRFFDRVAKSPFAAFCSSESEKRGFRFPWRGALMTFCEVITIRQFNFESKFTTKLKT